MANKGNGNGHSCERDATAYQLRCAGVRVETIRQQLGISSRQATYRAIERAQQKIEVDNPAQALQLAISRLEALLQAVWPSAVKGRVGAHQQALRVVVELAKLQNTYPSDELNVNLTGSPIFVTKVEHLAPAEDAEQVLYQSEN